MRVLYRIAKAIRGNKVSMNSVWLFLGKNIKIKDTVRKDIYILILPL